MSLGRALCAVAAVIACADPSGAETVLQNKDDLALVIARRGYCCVVDARSEARRKADPLANAVVYRKGVKLTPTAAIVVVADDDAGAVRTGRELERATRAGEVHAVQGGIATWRAFLDENRGSPLGMTSFIIPRNTCESGETLQQLPAGRR